MSAQETVSIAAESSHLAISSSYVVIATDAMSHHWALFQSSWVPESCCVTWSGSVCKVHIVLQQVQAVALMICKIAISNGVVALHFDNSIAKANLCNQCSMASLFLSRLACHISNLADLMAPASTHSSGCSSSLGSTRGESFYIFMYQSMSALLHLESPLLLGPLGLNILNYPWICHLNYVFCPSALVPQVISKFLAEHVTGLFSLVIPVAPCWMEAPW